MSGTDSAADTGASGDTRPMSYAPRSTTLSDLTWPEVGEALAAGWDTVVAAAGSIEQHGPHLPLVTETLFGEGLGGATGARLDRARRGAAVAIGCSEPRMGFPGAITLRKET